MQGWRAPRERRSAGRGRAPHNNALPGIDEEAVLTAVCGDVGRRTTVRTDRADARRLRHEVTTQNVCSWKKRLCEALTVAGSGGEEVNQEG